MGQQSLSEVREIEPITDGPSRLAGRARCYAKLKPELRAMLKFLLWLLLLAVCWPLALLALVAYPFVWLLTLPFRLLGITVDGIFGLLRAIITLPGRALSPGR